MLGERLKSLREQKGITQQEMADILGIARGTYAHYEIDRREPDNATLSRLADFFGVSVDYLLGRDKPKPSITDLFPDAIPADLSNFVPIPIVGTVKAGPNGLAYEEHLGYEYVDKKDVNGAKHIFLQVKGDSMIGEGILPGDLALVKEQPEVYSGDLAVVIVDDIEPEGRIKRVHFKGDSIVLQSANPSYPPEIFTGEERKKIRIVGKVKQTIRKY
ncbi:putative prophage repressor [Thermosinus carboxydivorans Nor1]|uniref:Putative prophage repressor n=1 Tax=Thermosinus carboxydivorans Nor1 TaxID=401526 RepID=A1HR30_9FIRM|nr:XRE family transcriptional regulator [Thermosinus carboxydivorans]EAX47536.1 putative prophage repressor [Thermosinus carboxydivorans Nor1]